MFPAGYLIANDKKIGWKLGVIASAAIIIRIVGYGNFLFSLIFPVVLGFSYCTPRAVSIRKSGSIR